MTQFTAFQPNAFQNDAFQVGVAASLGSPSYERRFFTDLVSGSTRDGEQAETHATFAGHPSASATHEGSGGTSRPFRRGHSGARKT